MNQAWAQIVMPLFNLQGIHLTSTNINFTLITSSVVFHWKFPCINLVFFYWEPFAVTNSGNVSYPLKNK